MEVKDKNIKEKGEENVFQQFLKQKIRVFYMDDKQMFRAKDGILILADENFIVIKTQSFQGFKKIGIRIPSIERWEVADE